MLKPPTPVDELLRLETLRNLKILDTDAEERFDRVTRLARRIFGTPIALVSLVDNDRQWFKSRQGLSATQTSRDISFCGHAILGDETMVVPDAQADERFGDNPLVTDDPNIRFYAGYPLSAPDGRKVGTLCVIDREPRELDEDDVQLLEELGKMVEEELAVASMIHSDPATGLSNNVGFSQIAEHLLAMCVRTDSPASLMLCHLTNQNVITSFLGKAEGDRAAIELTQLLMASFRDSDIIGRLTNEFFAVLLAGTPLENVDVAQHRLQTEIEARNARDDTEYELDVDSCAVAYDPKYHKSIEALLIDVESRLADDYPAASANDADHKGSANIA